MKDVQRKKKIIQHSLFSFLFKDFVFAFLLLFVSLLHIKKLSQTKSNKHKHRTVKEIKIPVY